MLTGLYQHRAYFSFFVKGMTLASFISFGTVPDLKEKLVMGPLMTSAACFKKRAGIPSRPVPLFTLKL